MASATSAGGEGVVRSDREVLDAYPDVVIDHDNIQHYRGRLERRLLVNRCDQCGHWFDPPRAICPRCWSPFVTPTAVSGGGTVALLTVLHHGARQPGIDYERGYLLAGVELVEQQGLRVVAPLVACTRDNVPIGTPVELTWVERPSPVPAFRPATV
jgi:hypothetical protein